MERETGVILRTLGAAAALLVTIIAPATAQTGIRRALLLGNSSYQKLKPLPASRAGVQALARTLAPLHFETQVVEDMNLDSLEQTIQKFATQLRAGDVALLFYGGYGLQVAGENYLLGVEFDPLKEQEIDYTAYSMRRAVSEIEGRGAWLNVLLFDAAHEDARLRQRYPQPGLGLMTPARPGTMIGFSAAANQSVVDAGSPGAYVRALVETLPAPAMTLPQVFAQIKRKVSDATGGRQLPAEMSTVVAEFRFNPKTEDVLAWEKATAGGAAALEAFVRAFPNSPHAAEARERLALLDKERQVAANRRLAEEALREYEQAFESRDIERLKVVWPGLGRQETSSFQEFFRIARTINLTLEPVGEPTLTAERATWVCRRRVEATDERGKLPSQETEIAIRMKRAGERMVIESITVGKK